MTNYNYFRYIQTVKNKSMTITEISKEIAEFTQARDWKNDNPSHLLVALNTEVGELSEYFLWKSKFDEDLSEEERRTLAYEMVDVLIYLLQISNKCGIEDLGTYYQEKIKKLGDKYPVDMNQTEWRKRHEEYKQNGKNKLYE